MRTKRHLCLWPHSEARTKRHHNNSFKQINQIILMYSYLEKNRKFFLFMTLLIALEIFLFSTISSFPIGEKTGLNLATFYHFGVFFMFTFFLSLTLINKKINNKTIIIILLISLIYALSDEFHQLFVPGRFCSLKDILVDLAGSLLSVLFIKILDKFNKL